MKTSMASSRSTTCEEAPPHPNRVEAAQALQVGPEHFRPEVGNPLGVATGRLAQ
jgi:hypothetical protein